MLLMMGTLLLTMLVCLSKASTNDLLSIDIDLEGIKETLTLRAVSDILSNFDSEEAMMEFKNHAAGIQTNPTTI
jgi:hypothetical protein